MMGNEAEMLVAEANQKFESKSQLRKGDDYWFQRCW
jgi:hypothetical protein